MKGIIHRDIKPENILVTLKDKEIKFCDFGTCRDAFDDTVKGAGTGRPGKRMFEHFVGTPNFMAPECMRNKGSEFSSDIYSLGGLIFQLQTGFPPFLGKSEFLIFLQSEKQDPIFKEELWEDSPDLQDLILQMMRKDMKERITIADIKKHKYFQDFDWNHLPTYEVAMSQFTQKERFFQNVKADLLENFNALNEKADKVDEAFNLWKSRLADIPDLIEEDKNKMYRRLGLMRQQANQLFNIGEFFWQDFQYDPPTDVNKNDENKSEESDE